MNYILFIKFKIIFKNESYKYSNSKPSRFLPRSSIPLNYPQRSKFALLIKTQALEY